MRILAFSLRSFLPTSSSRRPSGTAYITDYLLGAVSVLVGANSYALGGLMMGRHLRRVSPIVIALTSTSIAAAVALPAGVAQAPHAWPGWRPVVSVVVLGVPLLGFAYLLFFALITGPGAAYASTSLPMHK